MKYNNILNTQCMYYYFIVITMAPLTLPSNSTGFLFYQTKSEKHSVCCGHAVNHIILCSDDRPMDGGDACQWLGQDRTVYNHCIYVHYCLYILKRLTPLLIARRSPYHPLHNNNIILMWHTYWHVYTILQWIAGMTILSFLIVLNPQRKLLRWRIKRSTTHYAPAVYAVYLSITTTIDDIIKMSSYRYRYINTII